MANTSKKRKAHQKFRAEYSLLWPFIVKSREYVHCNICRTEVSIDNKAQIPGHKSAKQCLIILGCSNASGKCQ